jgi:hypothetical protein
MSKLRAIYSHKYPREAVIFQEDDDFLWKNLFAGYALPEENRFPVNTKVLTMGSCFAVNIANSLRNAGIDALALRLHEEANSPLANYYLVDYLRREKWSKYRKIFCKEIPFEKCKAFRNSVEEAGLFVLTLGVGICCFDRSTGQLILRPNSRDAINSEWRFLKPQEVFLLVSKLIIELRCINKKLTLVLTVSPVPMYRSFLAPSAFVDDCVSKCTLRCSVEQIIKNINNVYYWPTFELFRWVGSHLSAVYGADDNLSRHPNEKLVQIATNAFKKAFFNSAIDCTPLPALSPQELVRDLDES